MKNLINILLFIIPITLFAQVHEEQRMYEYDNLNRLVKVVFYSGIVYEYNYDNLGNRLGKTVDVELPYNNFTVNAIGLSCINSNDGSVIIEALRKNIYVVRLVNSDSNVAQTITSQAINNWELQFDNLDGGEYYLYITIQDIPETIFQKTFILNIDEPEPLEIVNRIANNGNSFDIDFIHGTAPYTITINGEVIGTTSNSSFNFEGKNGDILEITSSKACEGKYTEILNIADMITLYPNPTKKMLFFSMPSSFKETNVIIQLFDINGKQVGNFTPTIQDGKTNINIESLPSGVYIVKISSVNNQTFKIIKQ
ncbi:T9SS type A sorting domain-containing protein [Kordia sp.]|uniref:T9SS type A sorting domain-containing protein n=1 Tax=Kordia sp. TaxID=1965332 RepID=UPI003D2C698D